MAAEATAITRDEKGTLRYDYFLSDDGTKCMGNVSHLLRPLFELSGGAADAVALLDGVRTEVNPWPSPRSKSRATNHSGHHGEHAIFTARFFVAILCSQSVGPKRRIGLQGRSNPTGRPQICVVASPNISGRSS